MDDLKHFLPFLIVGICFGVGKAMKQAKGVSDWLIPPTLTALGLASGAATAAALGSDWRAWLDHSLIGLLAGAGAVGLHQAGRALTRQDTGSPPPASPSDDAGPSRRAPAGTASLRLAWRRFVLGATFALLCGCTAAEQREANVAIAAVCVPVVALVPVVGSEAPAVCVGLEDLVAEVEAYELAHSTKLALPTSSSGAVMVPAEVLAGAQRRAAARLTATR